MARHDARDVPRVPTFSAGRGPAPEQTEKSIVRKTPLVFIGNNLYEIDLLNIGKRKCLDNGELSLYLANVQSRWGLFKLTVRAMIGRLRQSRDFETLCLTECWIMSKRHHLHVSADGEVIELQPPLHYRSLHRALSVFVPPVGHSNVSSTPEHWQHAS